jgi:hypothetical protein
MNFARGGGFQNQPPMGPMPMAPNYNTGYNNAHRGGGMRNNRGRGSNMNPMAMGMGMGMNMGMGGPPMGMMAMGGTLFSSISPFRLTILRWLSQSTVLQPGICSEPWWSR